MNVHHVKIECLCILASDINNETNRWKSNTYRCRYEDKQRIAPHTPKSNKTWAWSKILKQEKEHDGHNDSITIHDWCCPTEITNIKVPYVHILFILHQISGIVTKHSKHENQSSGDPQRPIPAEIKIIHNTRECGVKRSKWLMKYKKFGMQATALGTPFNNPARTFSMQKFGSKSIQNTVMSSSPKTMLAANTHYLLQSV